MLVANIASGVAPPTLPTSAALPLPVPLTQVSFVSRHCQTLPSLQALQYMQFPACLGPWNARVLDNLKIPQDSMEGMDGWWMTGLDKELEQRPGSSQHKTLGKAETEGWEERDPDSCAVCTRKRHPPQDPRVLPVLIPPLACPPSTDWHPDRHISVVIAITKRLSLGTS